MVTTETATAESDAVGARGGTHRRRALWWTPLLLCFLGGYLLPLAGKPTSTVAGCLRLLRESPRRADHAAAIRKMELHLSHVLRAAQPAPNTNDAAAGRTLDVLRDTSLLLAKTVRDNNPGDAGALVRQALWEEIDQYFRKPRRGGN